MCNQLIVAFLSKQRISNITPTRIPDTLVRGGKTKTKNEKRKTTTATTDEGASGSQTNTKTHRTTNRARAPGDTPAFHPNLSPQKVEPKYRREKKRGGTKGEKSKNPSKTSGTQRRRMRESPVCMIVNPSPPMPHPHDPS